MFSAIKGAIDTVSEYIDSSNKIYITLNQPSYVGGDVVGGTVELVPSLPPFCFLPLPSPHFFFSLC